MPIDAFKLAVNTLILLQDMQNISRGYILEFVTIFMFLNLMLFYSQNNSSGTVSSWQKTFLPRPILSALRHFEHEGGRSIEFIAKHDYYHCLGISFITSVNINVKFIFMTFIFI